MARLKDDTPTGGWLGPNTPSRTDEPANKRKAIEVANGTSRGKWEWKTL